MMENTIEVWQWVSSDQADKEERPDVGALGGFFHEGMRWADYLAHTELPTVYAEALRRSILKNNIRFGGDDHQTGEDGTPIFTDGAVGNFSYRGWGDLLAAAWAEHEERDYSYMDFYMTCLVPESVEK